MNIPEPELIKMPSKLNMEDIKHCINHINNIKNGTYDPISSYNYNAIREAMKHDKLLNDTINKHIENTRNFIDHGILIIDRKK